MLMIWNNNSLFLQDLLESSTIEEILDKNVFYENRENKYQPKFIRGKGPEREGHCEICNKWYKLKTSSYWYHMNYKHGINSKGEKYPEAKIRQRERKVEAFCNQCNDWIPLGINKKGTKFTWLRHLQKNHYKK